MTSFRTTNLRNVGCKTSIALPMRPSMEVWFIDFMAFSSDLFVVRSRLQEPHNPVNAITVPSRKNLAEVKEIDRVKKGLEKVIQPIS